METIHSKLLDEIIHSNNNLEAANECEKICKDIAIKYNTWFISFLLDGLEPNNHQLWELFKKGTGL